MRYIYTAITALLLGGMAAQAADYQPLVREGVKWINHVQFVYYGEEPYYGPIVTDTLQFSGEEVITTESGTHTYKMVKGAYEVYMREEDKKVYLLDKQEMNDEFVIYDFSRTDTAIYNNGYGIVENFVLCDTAEIDGKQCRVFGNWDNTSFIIESIGLVSQTYGDLIHASLIPYAGGCYNYSLDHVEDLQGNIIYKSPFCSGNSAIGLVADDLTTRRDADPRWYDLLGHPFDSRPTQPGVYIHQGKKVVVK